MNKLVRKNRKGFTLTEMIVVIAIIGILAAVLIPSIIGYVKNAKQSAAYQEASSVLEVYETWKTSYEAGLTQHKYFGDYYEEIVEQEIPSQMYFRCDNFDWTPDGAVSFIFIDGSVVVEIDLETKKVSYYDESPVPEDSKIQAREGYVQAKNLFCE